MILKPKDFKQESIALKTILTCCSPSSNNSLIRKHITWKQVMLSLYKLIIPSHVSYEEVTPFRTNILKIDCFRNIDTCVAKKNQRPALSVV